MSTAAGTRAPVLVADRATLGYGGRPVLQDVDIEVRAGDFWFLLGPNGSGKSTLARAALGLMTPMRGQLRSTASVGYVPQHCALHPTIPTTLREYVSLGLATMKLARAECRERLEWAIAAVGLTDRTRDDMHALSGGMRQRAMVARALVRRPELLVLDEPTSHIDPGAQEALLAVLARLLDESEIAMLFVCHDVAVAARYATHVAFVHDGRVRKGGLSDDGETLARVYGLDVRVHLDADGHATFEMNRRQGARGASR